jgi:hypothetical protein
MLRQQISGISTPHRLSTHWAKKAREGIDGKVDKAELARRRSWSLVKRLG